jgi:hypothetical protein
MKLPTEAELIEMENRAESIETGITAIGQRIKFLDDHNFNGAPYWLVRDKEQLQRVAEDFKTLIDLARHPAQLLQNIPLDDALDRATSGSDTPGGSFHPPRTSVLKAMPSAQPQTKKKKR